MVPLPQIRRQSLLRRANRPSASVRFSTYASQLKYDRIPDQHRERAGGSTSAEAHHRHHCGVGTDSAAHWRSRVEGNHTGSCLWLNVRACLLRWNAFIDLIDI